MSNLELLIGHETYGADTSSRSQLKKSYVRPVGSGKIIAVDESEKYTSISQFFRTVFLPQGYPDSVSDDYLMYQLWDTIQAFASSITGTLAGQAMLKGVGVGDENATVLAATMTWLLKNGTGMVGRIVFAWLHGTSFDSDAKRWRLFADVANDFAIFLEILAPYLGAYFTVVVCTAGVAKSLVGVAGGATRASLTLHQAKRNNMADVSAKDGSQETIVNLAGLLCSLALVPMVADKSLLIWSLFMLFTSLHLFANYSAVRAVVMETVNQARLHLLVQEYVISRDILSLKTVNYREPVLHKTRWKLPVDLGCSFETLLPCIKDTDSLRSIFGAEKYLLGVNFAKSNIHIVLERSCTVLDQLKACFQAEIINFACDHMTNQYVDVDVKLQQLIEALKDENTEKVVRLSYEYTETLCGSFLDDMVKAGWLTEPSLLGPDEWRAVWDFNGLTNKKGH